MVVHDKSFYSLFVTTALLVLATISFRLTDLYTKPLANSLQDTFIVAINGDRSANEQMLQAVETLLVQYPEDALLTAYYGSTLALKARDSWLTVNRIEYAKEGVYRLNEALSQLSRDSYSTPYSGLNEKFYIQSLAAITFINMPDNLYQSERGYRLLKSVMESEEFQYYPFNPRAWIHIDAVKAALHMGEPDVAKEWATQMHQLAPTHPQTLAALHLTDITALL